MSRHLLLASGSFAALTIAASFFGATPAMAQFQVHCVSSDGTTLPGTVASGSTITCTGTTSEFSPISNSPSANNVSVVLQQNASVTSNFMLPPTTFTFNNNASLTVNNGASLVSSGSGKSGTAFFRRQ